MPSGSWRAQERTAGADEIIDHKQWSPQPHRRKGRPRRHLRFAACRPKLYRPADQAQPAMPQTTPSLSSASDLAYSTNGGAAVRACRILHHCLHLLGIGDEVRWHIAAIELQPSTTPNSITSRRAGGDWPQCSDVRRQGMMYMLNFAGRNLV